MKQSCSSVFLHVDTFSRQFRPRCFIIHLDTFGLYLKNHVCFCLLARCCFNCVGAVVLTELACMVGKFSICL